MTFQQPGEWTFRDKIGQDSEGMACALAQFLIYLFSASFLAPCS